MIKYQNREIPVFSIAPDWSKNPTIKERFGGVIYEALSTAEQRIATGPRVLRSIQFDTLTLSEQEQGYIRKIIEQSSSMPIAIPIWPFRRLLTATPLIGNSFVKCDPLAGAIFDVVPYSILWNSWNYFETFRTFDAGTAEVQFADQITKQFSAGDSVVPLAVGHFSRDSVSAITDANSVFSVKFDEQLLTEIFATPFALTGAEILGQPAFEYMLIGGDRL